MPSIPLPTPKQKRPIGWQRAMLEIEEDGSPIEGWFNPKEYTVTKGNDWKVEKVVGQDLPTAQFSGGDPRTITLSLLLDSSDKVDGDVRDVTKRLFKMMDIDPKLAKKGSKNGGRPPMVTFTWGEVVSFKAVVKRLSVQYLLFHPDGRPIRAQIGLDLAQAERAEDGSNRPEPKKQNPTTRGDVREVHRVRDGDSLASVAYSTLGDATLWRAIAEANGIDDPLRLTRGSELAIPGNA